MRTPRSAQRIAESVTWRTRGETALQYPAHILAPDFFRSLTMIGVFARWGHNVLLVGMGLLTIVLLVVAR
jgi:hypothetical protein